ncbi:MAG: hypothetical protein KIT62_16640 [Cyclobacteriaceae bacterium]|nr:hypothetical protein [Cyclobacteriaceae bacterium]
MSTLAEIKSAIHQQVANTEDRKLLLKVQNYLRSLNKEKRRIVAYTSDLKPLTVDQYRSEIRKSMEQYRSDRVVSQKEMEKSI